MLNYESFSHFLKERKNPTVVARVVRIIAFEEQNTKIKYMYKIVTDIF